MVKTFLHTIQQKEHDDLLRESFFAALFMLAIMLSCALPPLVAQQLTPQSPTPGIPASTSDKLTESVNFPRIGVYAQGVGNVHWANFAASANGVQCCPPFRNGLGTAFAGGATMQFPLEMDSTVFARFNLFDIHRRFSVNVRGGIVSHQAWLRSSGDTVLEQGGMRSARIDYAMNAQLLSGGGELALSYRLGEQLPVREAALQEAWILSAGVRVGFFAQRVYSQTRTIADPLNRAVWQNGMATDTMVNNQIIPNVMALNLDAAVILGLRREIPLLFTEQQRNHPNTAFVLAPEVQISLPITSIVPNRGWSHARLQAGLAIFFPSEFPPKPAPPKPLPPPPDSVKTPAVAKTSQPDKPDSVRPKASPTFAVQLIKTVQDTSGKTLPAVRINIEDHVARRVFPLLTEIFFEQGSDAIPGRYKRLLVQDTGSFTTKKLLYNKKFGSLDVYHDVLNILGRRLKENPASTVTLTGCLGAVGKGVDSEEADKTLSLRRAEAVRNYLWDIWGIAPNRIAVIGRGLPAKPSQTTDELAKEAGTDVADNRRVEITSSEWEITKPVLDDDTLSVANFPVVRFTAQMTPKDSAARAVKSWSLQVKQNGAVVTESKGTTVNVDYLWNIEYAPPRSNTPVQIVLDVETITNEHIITQDTIGIEYLSVTKKRTTGAGDVEKNEFRLVGFEFGNTGLTADHKRIIKEYILPVLNFQSTLQITGHTDAFGKDESNQRLSRLRAEAISQEIGFSYPAFISGEGNKKMLYSNKTPEGRFYSRTVQVLAETPIE
ncbi:MAG: hypothetical protein EAZ92_14755 [Candidatus Kapaibacterium sp.]|nr:MAG: hypothetical protein EAZ92_14755 [Candidatus Kapabacteria bacterium]